MSKVWAKQSDIAREANVSLATVDRCLNNRPGVSIHAQKRIHDAIEKLQNDSGAALFNVHTPLTLDIILPGGPNSFLNLLAQSVEQLATDLKKENITIRLHRVEGFAPQILADCILKVAKDSDGMAIMALENPVVREAVSTVNDKGIPVVTVVSNLATQKTIGYVGLNNRAAGRTAAYLVNLIAKTKQGGVALFEGSLDLAYSDHQEREFGFTDALREYAPHMKVIGKWATQDNHEEAYEKTKKVLQDNPELVAIYSIGGGIRGIGRALQDSNRDKEVICIGHDLTSHTREFLLNGTLDAVINQDPAAEAKAAFQQLIDFHRKGSVDNSLIHIKTEVFFRENLP